MESLRCESSSQIADVFTQLHAEHVARVRRMKSEQRRSAKRYAVALADFIAEVQADQSTK